MYVPHLWISDVLSPGDLAYVLSSHQAHYAKTQGYPAAFEYIVLRALQELYESIEREERSRVWTLRSSPAGAADMSQRFGSIVLQDRGALAQLRLFYVDEAARGTGRGKDLLNTFIRYASAVGFSGIYLWTTPVQTAAVALYGQAGFTLTEERRTTSFGVSQLEQRYALTLRV